MKDDLVFRVAGDSGDGSNATGEMLAQACARSGLYVFTFRTTPAEIKGGPVMFQVRASNKPLYTMGDAIDVLFAFNQEAWDLHHDDLAANAAVLYDSDAFSLPSDYTGLCYAVPINRLAHENGDRRGKNVVALGVTATLFGLRSEKLIDIVRRRLGKKLDRVESNLKSLQAGIDFVKTHVQKVDPFWIQANGEREQLMMTGNQAIVAGALQGGIGFFAGYPITPASDIMEGLAPILPTLGGSYLQAEDEIASIMSCIGASYAGKKAMTATSGPGLSLMVEAIGYASMAEIPVVIVNVQRGGPSTGLPTKMEQSDLDLAVHGGHGDAPRIVVAPANVAECFHLTVSGFNLAEEYQSPVIILSDYSLAFCTETIEPLDGKIYPCTDRQQPEGPLQPGVYKRYILTERGVSPMALPGTPNAEYTATGLEHDEQGDPIYTPTGHTTMTDKRWRKFEPLKHSHEFVRHFGSKQAKVGLLCWGTTVGPARGAVSRALHQNLPVSMFQVQMLSPLPEDAIREFVASVTTVLVPEVNFQGQFARQIRLILGARVRSMTQYTGLPFTESAILRKIYELLELAR